MTNDETPARVAGVREIIAVCPRPEPAVMAADAAGESSLVAESRAGLAHRRLVRRRAAAEPDLLAGLRAGSDACLSDEPATGELGGELVSVLLPVLDEPIAAVLASIASVIAQDHVALELIVAIPSETVATAAAARFAPLIDAIVALDDPRIRIVLSSPDSRASGSPADPAADAEARRAIGLQLAADAATGSWFAPLVAGDRFTVDHVGLLVSVAREHRLEFVYGRGRVAIAGASGAPGEPVALDIGEWPPSADGVLHGSELYAAALRAFAYDPQAWRAGETVVWDHWRRLLSAGVRVANIEQVVVERTLYREAA